MVEKIRHINNPLTIIAIFAGLAEISGTITIGIINEDSQKVFVWFLMLFPASLVLSFFLVIYFRPGVLYAPSDFKDEGNFFNAVGKKAIIENEIKELKEDLMNAYGESVVKTISELGSKIDKNNIDRIELEKSLTKKFEPFRLIIDTKTSNIEKVLANEFPSHVEFRDISIHDRVTKRQRMRARAIAAHLKIENDTTKEKDSNSDVESN